MLNSKPLTYTVLSLVWLVNPVVNVGCDNGKYGPDFGETEMLELMEEINGEVWTLETDEGSYTVAFTLRQKSAEEVASSLSVLDFMGSAHACGDRTFMASANACIEHTTLVLEGNVRVTDTLTDETLIESMEVTGEMIVLGDRLNNANVALGSESGSFILDSQDGSSFTLSSANWD